MVWYPREELIIYIHDEQIHAYGGRLGFHRDSSLLTRIIKATREYDGDIYQKAAFLLRELITAHVFEDGQHRTGFMVAAVFLRENGESLHCADYRQARSFLKSIRMYNVDQIAEWLRHGCIP